MLKKEEGKLGELQEQLSTMQVGVGRGACQLSSLQQQCIVQAAAVDSAGLCAGVSLSTDGDVGIRHGWVGSGGRVVCGQQTAGRRGR